MHAKAEMTRASVEHPPARVGLFGCPLDTGNRGVSALALSTLDALTDGEKPVEITMFDYGEGTRDVRVNCRTGPFKVIQVGCFHSRRYHRLNNLSQMRVAARLGLRQLHPMLRCLGQLDVVLDISGGDSFSDIYGSHRFAAVSLPKRLVSEMRLPLVLLPQTFGPYRAPKARAVASQIVRAATQVWARDPSSYAVLQDLLGNHFDPERHRCGVDMAFGLRQQPPDNDQLLQQLQSIRASGKLLVGLNVSGMLSIGNQDIRRFGFLDPYRDTIDRLVRRLLSDPQVHLLLVPHVTSKSDPDSGDAAANQMLVSSLSNPCRERVTLVPGDLGPSELKFVIGQCHWFCGTRMHACIAALSQGVPSTSIAYSDKTAGVFATAGMDEEVLDPRVQRSEAIVEGTLRCLNNRERAAQLLRDRLPLLRKQLHEQHQELHRCINTLRRPAHCQGESPA